MASVPRAPRCRSAVPAPSPHNSTAARAAHLRYGHLMTTTTAGPGPSVAGVGTLLRGWRERRRISQLELALRAGSSARHISFIETGRSRPSQSMVLRLAEHLEVPVR